jgi:low temperature requirement protein LtrA
MTTITSPNGVCMKRFRYTPGRDSVSDGTTLKYCKCLCYEKEHSFANADSCLVSFTLSRPHVNWGDLYFDLFYVGAAFQLAASFMESPNVSGLLVFASCYLPVVHIWHRKVVYDSKYAPEDNLYHRFLEVLSLCVLGTVVQHIRPVFYMVNTAQYATTFVFTTFLSLESLLMIRRELEVYQRVVGGPEAKRDAMSQARSHSFYLCFSGIAAVWSGCDYFLGDASITHPSQPTPVNYGPLLLCGIVGYICQVIFTMVDMFVITPSCRMKPTETFRDFRVPLNLEFMLHRMGEWIMLMLGESVLALLLVESSLGKRYYVTFYAGILTVTIFQYLFFRSQPYGADDHAMRRSRPGGYFFYHMSTIYSASLILVGCSYKMILHYYLFEEELEEGGDTNVHLPAGLSLGELETRIAWVYGLSLGVSFISLDGIVISHRGFRANLGRYLDVDGRLLLVPIVVTALNYTLIFGAMSLALWVPDLAQVSMAGLLIASTQVSIRTMWLRHFPVSKSAMAACNSNFQQQHSNVPTSPDGEDNRAWPNITEAQIE